MALAHRTRWSRDAGSIPTASTKSGFTTRLESKRPVSNRWRALLVWYTYIGFCEP